MKSDYIPNLIYRLLSFFIGVVLMPALLTSQSGKPSLDFKDYALWKKIENEKIAPDGSIVVYHEVPGKGDQSIKIKSTDGSNLLSYDRAENSAISDDSRFVFFLIKPALNSIRALKRLKTKEEDLPTDSLGIYDTHSNRLTKIANVKSYSMPEEWNGYIVYMLDILGSEEAPDSIDSEDQKKTREENGYHLIIHNLNHSTEDTLMYVKDYQLAKAGMAMIYHSTGKDSTEKEGVYYFDFNSMQSTTLMKGDYQYSKLSISENGRHSAFIVDKEEEKSYHPRPELKYWTTSKDSVETVINNKTLAQNWIVNIHQALTFSQDGSKLYFHTSPSPFIKDTLLLEDEIIQVEVWNYKDQRLVTQQNVELERDEKRAYAAIYHTDTQQFYQLANENIPYLSFGKDKDRNHRYAFGYNDHHYKKQVSWEGGPTRRDIYLIDQQEGTSKLIIEEMRGRGDISPAAKYLYWYNLHDTAYYAYEIESGEIRNLTAYIPTQIVDERDDHPDYPPPYGLAGWTAADASVLIYDRFDIWEVDPGDPMQVQNLTNGRGTKDRYRMRLLDPERAYVSFEEDHLHIFNEVTRAESYSRFETDGQVNHLYHKEARLRDLQKAREASAIIFTEQTHTQFPDIQLTNLDFAGPIRLSNANPQQQDRRWSTVELTQWTSLDGLSLEGLLYKPENFDPTKKYPLMVYFYERDSDNLHRYWGAYPHRSIINPSFYASRGYIVFVADIIYKDGYPGPSCYNSVIPGVTKLIDQGYIDIDRIGVQGHSWGGYQSAYLVTRTNMFACAESGAPVANMISAYGGIRWGSGLSRMFQYERTQSRIGGTLWDYPMRYFENSPIFFVDKINTPVLIMHNDHDTAVPWYQGIELFVALRRLNKPAWMLNYIDEPHWPTKWENIVDFNIRMQQFFDHYLMGSDMPEWMEKGIPATERGYNKAYD